MTAPQEQMAYPPSMVGAEVDSGSGIGVGFSVAVGANISNCSPLGVSIGFNSAGCAVGMDVVFSWSGLLSDVSVGA